MALCTEAVSAAAARIHDGTHLFIGAGAGCSADSGLQVFAQVSQSDVFASEGLTYDQVASSDMLARDTRRCLGFWAAMEGAYRTAEPHAGYDILRGWRAAKDSFVVTSNVDGFFCRDSDEGVAEIHGNVRTWQCGGEPSGAKFPLWKSNFCSRKLHPPPRGLSVDAAQRLIEDVPTCTECRRGILRPHIYLFGDGERFVGDERVVKAAAQKAWRQQTVDALHAGGARLVIIEIGCGLRVPSVRKRCEDVFLSAKAAAGDPSHVTFIRINPDYPGSTLVAGAEPTFAFKAGALDTLAQLQAAMPQP
eukprot:TRINITY_DN23291_c0_g1_i1.p1 TRINITY_DN23291_c0_g1~~TRINITY_DN23291_c0_g1_i1.p1  ORF type:complete len:305 (+),score=69.90 TRINITY_DN23291_c0_g1_i1:48-962(+)